MKDIEQKTIESFDRAKTDIMMLRRDVSELHDLQKTIVSELNSLITEKRLLEKNISDLHKKFSSTIKKSQGAAKPKAAPVRRAKVRYVASKAGKYFHAENCPFAKNIKPKSKIRFASKVKALNAGYKPCVCVQK